MTGLGDYRICRVRLWGRNEFKAQLQIYVLLSPGWLEHIMFFSCSVARLFPSPVIRGQLRVVRQVMSGLTMSAEMHYLDPPMSYLFGSPN